MEALTEGTDTMMRFLARCLTLACLLLGIGLGAAAAKDISAGPIWNNWDAQNKCPGVCAPGTWNGNWRTVQAGVNSVCSCDFPRRPRHGGNWPPYRIQQIMAGPIWGNWDAPGKCTRACGGPKLWDGNWRTVGPGQSTCDCYVPR